MIIPMILSTINYNYIIYVVKVTVFIPSVTNVCSTACWLPRRLLTAIVNRGGGLSYFHVIWFVRNSIERYGVSVWCSFA